MSKTPANIYECDGCPEMEVVRGTVISGTGLLSSAKVKSDLPAGWAEVDGSHYCVDCQRDVTIREHASRE